MASLAIFVLAGIAAATLNFLPAGGFNRLVRLSGTDVATNPGAGVHAAPTEGLDSAAENLADSSPKEAHPANTDLRKPEFSSDPPPSALQTPPAELASSSDPSPGPPLTIDPSLPPAQGTPPTTEAPVALDNSANGAGLLSSSTSVESPPSLLPEIKSSDAETIGAAAVLPIDPSKSVVRAAATPDESILGAPQQALRDFLAAPTWKHRLNFAQVPDKVRSEMQEYYRTHPDGPQQPTSISFMTSGRAPGGKFSVYLFHVTFPDLPQGFPLAVEETASGWRVDWKSFVEFRDGHLRQFLAQFQDLPATFQVKLQRTHYFDKDVPSIEDKYCFRVAAPVYGHEGYVFVDKRDSIVGPKLADKLNWEETYHVIAKLKWVKSPTGHEYIELRDIVADSWRAESDPRLGKN